MIYTSTAKKKSVKRFLLATRLIVAQIAEFLRPRGPGFNEKSPSENDTEGDKSIKKKSETEEVTFTHADPFDAYDSSDEDKAVRSDTEFYLCLHLSARTLFDASKRLKIWISCDLSQTGRR